MRFPITKKSVAATLTNRSGRWPVIVCAATLGLLSVWNIQSAIQMQARLDQEYTVSFTSEVLRAPLKLGQDRALREAVRQLIRRPDLGLKFLSVSDPSGLLLATAGRFENLNIPILSAQSLQKLREWFYEFGSQLGHAVVMIEDRPVGSFDYVISGNLVGEVHDAAVRRLLWSGGIGLLLGAGLLFWRGRDGSVQATSALLQRMVKTTVSENVGESSQVPAPEVEKQVAQALRLRVGGTLEQLNYGLVLADRQARVRYLNKVAESLTGWSLADARDRLVYSVFHPMGDQGEPLVNAAEQSLKLGHQVTAIECRLRARGGGVVQIEMMASLLRNTDGSVDGVAMLFRDTSQNHRRMEEFKRQSRLSQSVIDHLEEGLLTTDPSGVVRSANARAQRMFGYAREELEGVTVTKLMPVPFLNTPRIKLLDYTGGKGSLKLPKVVGWRKDATTFPAELQVQPMNVGDDAGLVVIVRDISERLRGDNLATRLGRLLDSALEEVYIFDAQSLYFLEVNRGARKNLGYRQEQLAHMTPLSISTQLEEADFLSCLSRLRGGEVEHLSYRCSHKRSDGSEYPVEIRLNFSREEEPPVFMAIAVDISDRLGAEEQLKYMAHHDALTGLPTRVVLYDRLRQALLAAGRSNRMVAVYFVDIDLFKQINDSHGHETGDAVLKCVSERLKSLMRGSDTVARLAGDEFIVVASGVQDGEAAEALAQKMVESFRHRLDVPDHDITVSISVGVSVYPLDDSDADALLRHADSAMYTAKRAGRDGYRLFSTDIDPDRRRRLDLEREIHAAVALNQCRLLLAPVTDENDTVQARLASVCWEHPRYGRIGSDEAVAAAIRAGSLADLELWLICNACAQIHAAVESTLPVLPMIVGISGWQLRDSDFSEHVLQLLLRFEVPPRMLILSLSQDGLSDADTVAVHIETLIKRGVRFALRNFSGNFDLSDRGRAMSFELVLLPEELVARMLDDAEAATQLRSIIEAALGSGSQIVVPGVADTGTRAYLRTLGPVLIAGPVHDVDAAV